MNKPKLSAEDKATKLRLIKEHRCTEELRKALDAEIVLLNKMLAIAQRKRDLTNRLVGSLGDVLYSVFPGWDE